MRKAFAVIGSGYGDEGKGLMTDFLAVEVGASVVARTNGGSQAGHTVQVPDGRRHVFHHVASGALAGVPTHLTSFFVSHPMFFMRELEELRSMGANTSVSVDPRGVVTTPYDVALNQVAEEARGAARHGSCGVGFGEALERSTHDDLRLSVGDLAKGEDHIRKMLHSIRSEWVLERLARLGVQETPTYLPAMLSNDRIVERFIDDCAAFWHSIVLRDDAKLPDRTLFEGAQGLLLDQDYGAFPHVTRSNTGLKNMVAVAQEAEIAEIDVRYMTRAYATRHGAGPFAYADAETTWLSMNDPTNEPNPWQGTIRTAPVDLDAVDRAIRHDLGHASGRITVRASLGVSCVDQVSSKFEVGVDGRLEEIDRRSVAEVFAEVTGLPVEAVSYGPTRANVADMTRHVAVAV